MDIYEKYGFFKAISFVRESYLGLSPVKATTLHPSTKPYLSIMYDEIGPMSV